MKTTRSLPVLRTLCGIAVLTAAAALPLNSEAATLTLYNAQHEQVVAALAKDFEKQTGISMKIRNGEGPAMAEHKSPLPLGRRTAKIVALSIQQ